jgi:hypothetical protein
MQGTIRSRDVLVHSVTILWHFGFFAYLRCVRAMVRGVVHKETSTFLDVLYTHRTQN